MPYVDQDKQRDYHRQWVRKNRERFRAWARQRRDENAAYLTEFKLKKGCTVCGYKLNAAALQFDHVRGTKHGGVTNFLSTRSLMLRELAKCEVVCSNCHSIRTHTRRQQGIIIPKNVKPYNKGRH